MLVLADKERRPREKGKNHVMPSRVVALSKVSY